MSYLKKNLGKKIPGISGVAGGGVLFFLLGWAVLRDPGAGNLWLALVISVLMVVAGVAALRSTRREKGPGGHFGKSRTTS